MPVTTTLPALSRIARDASLAKARVRRLSLRASMKRVNVEHDVLGAIAAHEKGAAFGTLCEKCPDLPMTEVLDELVANHQVERHVGPFFSITPLGRSRLSPAPPACVASL